MNLALLQDALLLAARVGHVLIGTCDRQGVPHLATAGKMAVRHDGPIAISAWFCPGTVANLQDNPQVSIVAWDPQTDHGFQILGAVEDIEEMAVLDGYMPGQAVEQIPQVERRLIIQPQKIMRFRLAPHSDQEE